MNRFWLDITRVCIITLFFVFVFVANDVKSQSTESIKTTIYISSVDSTEDFYVLLSHDSTRKYKIVSRKVPVSKPNIQIGKEYDVTLININNSYPIGLQIHNPCDVFFNFGEGNMITNDVESKCEIYYCEDFFGLYYTTDISEQNELIQWIKNNPIEVKSICQNFRKRHLTKRRFMKSKIHKSKNLDR